MVRMTGDRLPGVVGVVIDEPEMTATEMRAMFPELFKIAAQLRARDPAVRLHSFRIAGQDSEGKRIAIPVRIKKEPGV